MHLPEVGIIEVVLEGVEEVSVDGLAVELAEDLVVHIHPHGEDGAIILYQFLQIQVVQRRRLHPLPPATGLRRPRCGSSKELQLYIVIPLERDAFLGWGGGGGGLLTVWRHHRFPPNSRRFWAVHYKQNPGPYRSQFFCYTWTPAISGRGQNGNFQLYIIINLARSLVCEPVIHFHHLGKSPKYPPSIWVQPFQAPSIQMTRGNLDFSLNVYLNIWHRERERERRDPFPSRWWKIKGQQLLRNL